MRTNTVAVASPAPKKRHASQKARTAISTTIIYIILGACVGFCAAALLKSGK